MVFLNNISIPFGIKLRSVRKIPLLNDLKYKFIYEFDVYVNENRIIYGLVQKADSIEQLRDIITEDFICGIKKIMMIRRR